MNIKKINLIVSTIIILTNIYFVPMTILLIKDNEGTWGFGAILIPILVPANLLLITAGLTFIKRYRDDFVLLFINGIGLIWNLFWIYKFIIH
ncbi:MAG: hypothetical protein ABI207_04535 [Crocinitomicaceae bacterium]